MTDTSRVAKVLDMIKIQSDLKVVLQFWNNEKVKGAGARILAGT
jgi:hypothetical protein